MSSVTDILNKLKQLPQARLSQFVVAGLLIYVAAIVADITWTLLPGTSAGEPMAIKMQQPGSSRHSGPSLNIAAITRLNLFGDHQAVAVEQAPVVEAVTVAPETTLNLKLSATVAEGVSQDQGRGTAIIESAGQQDTYGVGDKIKATTATVHQVFTDRVILQVGNRHETLMLDGVDYSSDHNSDNDQNNVSASLPGKRTSPLVRKTSPGRKQASTKRKVDKRKDRRLTRQLSQQRRDVLADPAKLMDFIRISPVRKNGELVGYRLNPSRDPQLFKQAGLLPNDLAVEINGYALNDMQQAMTVLKELREMDEANIVVMRNGARTEILFGLEALDNIGDEEKRNVPAPKASGGKLN